MHLIKGPIVSFTQKRINKFSGLLRHASLLVHNNLSSLFLSCITFLLLSSFIIIINTCAYATFFVVVVLWEEFCKYPISYWSISFAYIKIMPYIPMHSKIMCFEAFIYLFKENNKVRIYRRPILILFYGIKHLPPLVKFRFCFS